jgi:hypothetical protein
MSVGYEPDNLVVSNGFEFSVLTALYQRMHKFLPLLDIAVNSL